MRVLRVHRKSLFSGELNSTVRISAKLGKVFILVGRRVLSPSLFNLKALGTFYGSAIPVQDRTPLIIEEPINPMSSQLWPPNRI